MGIDLDKVKSIPPTLRNVAKELENDIGLNVEDHPFDFSLETWAKQGVLMLNTALTVEEGLTKSHFDLWQPFTMYLLDKLKEASGLIFVMLGRDAQRFKKVVCNDYNYCVTAPHPAAEVYAGGKAGFFGSRIFSQIDSILKENHSYKIQWQNLQVLN